MFFLTTCGVIAAWVFLLMFDHPTRHFAKPPLRPAAADLLALTISLIWSGVLYSLEYHNGTPRWPNLIYSALTAVTLYGVIAAILVRGRELLLPAIVVQVITLLIVVLVPFGSGSQPSAWGFNVADALALSGANLLATLGGAAAAFAIGWHRLGWVQLLAFVPSTFLMILAEQFQDGVHYW